MARGITRRAAKLNFNKGSARWTVTAITKAATYFSLHMAVLHCCVPTPKVTGL